MISAFLLALVPLARGAKAQTLAAPLSVSAPLSGAASLGAPLSVAPSAAALTVPALASAPSATALPSAPRAGLPAAATAAAAEPAPLPSSARAAAAAPAPDVRLIRDFPSDALGNRRTVAVYLPPGYDSSNARYPVLYMQDGQNLFDPALSHSGVSWGVGQAAQELILSGRTPPFIIVAPYNTDRRTAEYTRVTDAQEGGGDGALYARFLVDELKPFIDANLRTRTGAADTAIAGSSLGGLLSLDLAFAHPETFSRAAALSPSLWWSDRELARRVAAAASLPHPRLWIDMGTREGSNPARFDAHVQNLRDLAAILRARGWNDGADLAAVVVPGATHDEAAWAARIRDVLLFLFPRR